MSKIAIIKNCKNCPHFDYVNKRDTIYRPDEKFYCGKLDRWIKGDPYKIHKDCSLEDEKIEKISHAAIVRSDGILEIAKCHPEIIGRCPYGTCKAGSKQGFVTSTGRYVDRKEALKIALEAGQINKDMDTIRQSGLISENLWADTDHEYNPEIGYYIPDPIKEGLAYILGQIINDLPTNRDWLDPALEKSAVSILKNIEK